MSVMSVPLEIVRPGADASQARVVLFDFDGTLSLIRAGWVDVMVPMMLEELVALNSGERSTRVAGGPRSS